MTAVVESDRGQLILLQSMLHGSVAHPSMPELNDYLRGAPHEFAVVIGPSIDIEDAAAFAQWARVQRPDLGVILMRHVVDSEALAVALRSGMREVVDSRDLAGVATAVQRARTVASAIGQTMMGEAQAAADAAKAEAAAEVAAAQAAAHAASQTHLHAAAPVSAAAAQGHVTTVFSNKGGVGKSLIATNISVALAEAGQTVCLVDLDVNNGDVAIMLQISPSRTINDLSAFAGVIDEGSVMSILTQHSTNMAIVAAPVTLDATDRATVEDVGKMLDVLKEQFAHVVIDTSGVLDDFSLAALDRSDRIVLVATLDIPSLKGLKLAVNTLDLLNYPRERWTLVLNRADSKVGLTAAEFESTLGITVDHSMVSSREVLAAVNSGEALVSAYPGHPNSKVLQKLASSVSGARIAGVESVESPDRKSTTSRLRLRRA